MAIGVIENARLLVGGYDLSGAMNAVNLDELAPLLEATTVADVGKARKGGMAGVTLAASGFCDPEIEPGLAAGLALTDVPVSVVPVDTEGELAYFFRALLARLEPLGGAMDDMAEMSIDAESSQGEATRGILCAHRTVTASGTGTAFEMDPGGSGRLVTAALHITAASASDTLDIVIESAADEAFTSATTRLTFAQASAVGYEWGSLAHVGTDTWWRVKWTVAGTSPSFTFAVTMSADTAAVGTASDAFTDTENKWINNHTPDAGFTSWIEGMNGPNALFISSNKLKCTAGFNFGRDHVLALPALEDDGFELFADIVPAGNSATPGIKFRCDDQIKTVWNDSATKSDFIGLYLGLGSGPTLATFNVARYADSVQAENYAVASSVNLGADLYTAGVRLGVTVAGATVQAWSEPYGGGTRTNRGSAKTMLVTYLDGLHKQFGLWRGGNGEINTTWDNLTLTYLA